MSDLSYPTDEELVRRLRHETEYQRKLEQEISKLEYALKLKKRHLGGSHEKVRWIIKYLSGESVQEEFGE